MGRRLQIVWVVGSYLLTMVVGLFSNMFQNVVSKLAVLGVGLLLSLGMFYSKHYRPMVDVDQAKLEKFCEAFLFPRLKQTYKLGLRKAYNADYGGSQRAAIEAQQKEILNDLRINVMVYKRRDYRPWGHEWVAKLKPWQKSLMIEFSTGDYNEAEKNLKWRDGIGCCGHAIADGGTYAGDIQQQDRERWNVPATYQKSMPSDLSSVLSIPIYKQTRGGEATEGPVVAVLNIDSTYGLEDTYFEEEHVTKPLVKLASFLGVFL